MHAAQRWVWMPGREGKKERQQELFRGALIGVGEPELPLLPGYFARLSALGIAVRVFTQYAAADAAGNHHQQAYDAGKPQGRGYNQRGQGRSGNKTYIIKHIFFLHNNLWLKILKEYLANSIHGEIFQDKIQHQETQGNGKPEGPPLFGNRGLATQPFQ